MWFFEKYWKVILSMILSFITVFFVIPFFMTSGKLTSTVGNLYGSLSYLKSLNFSKLFTLQFNPSSNNETPLRPSGFEGQAINFNLPTSDPNRPINQTPTSPAVLPPKASATGGVLTEAGPTPNDDELVDFPIENGDINNIPGAPTKPPKPTKPPDIFPIDPSLARYGKTTDEVFTYASQKTCVPVAVLKGIAYIESGGFFDVVDPKYFLLYNSENWWNSQFLTEEKRACGGYDYDNGSGIVPSDSKYAGHNCHSDGSAGANSYIMGPMQVTGSEQSKFASQVKSATGAKQVDRRIILDAILIVGFISKQNVNPTSCSNWTGYQVAKAACGYYGSCGFADGTYYCNTFCRNYKSFGGKTDCQGAVNQMQDNCWGQ